MRITAVLVAVLLTADTSVPLPPAVPAPAPREKPAVPSLDASLAGDFSLRLAAAAEKQTEVRVTYDASYTRIGYPGGDVAPDKGVCADVVIRAYRVLGMDLQVLVHRDMVRAFALYPKRWGLTRTDTNIDHRRVPNLETFFRRHGRALATSTKPDDYRPGDLVSWIVAGSLPHIGIVSAKRSADGSRPLMIHNIGEGPKLEDVLFEFPIVGHFRYAPAPRRTRRPA